jgi:D-alanyl-lipoteichoic acid acyltransferase DltB (MBOAT superfamily)
LIGFFFLGKHSQRVAAAWLALASLIFYGSWDYRYIPLLLGSIVLNFLMSLAIVSDRAFFSKKKLLVLAVCANLLLLGYYKYADFFLASIYLVSGFKKIDINIILPIGISFFTFTQIAFLIDTYQGKVKEFNFIHYTLFVTYFPHLIAGPVLHHKEMMPQFGEKKNYLPSADNFAIGISIFIIGLIKKVIIADSVAPLASPIFQPEAHPALLEAWIGALAYTMQLYFDFSGYSDMAIGLSRMFGVRLPLNFNSPYKADNIIDFWRRWHMTLSRFLRDYLYIPLGGNRNGTFARFRNLFITMLLGGLWHGAGWTYVIWGGLHGVYLVVNHGWHALIQKLGLPEKKSLLRKIMARCLTFVSVVIAWVFFRSPDFATAIDILSGMTGMNGISLPAWTKSQLDWLEFFGWPVKFEGIRYIDFGSTGFSVLIIAIGLVWLTPNTQEIMRDIEPCLESVIPNKSIAPIKWQLSTTWLIFISIGFLLCIFNMNKVSEFLYFQF